MRTIVHPLRGDTPGAQRQVVSHHFGTIGARPKVYMQASLHAGEIPGMIALHHLAPHLAKFEAEGRIVGEIVIVPVANPIGLAQALLHDNIGRHELHSTENFNRHYPDLEILLGDRLEGKLGPDGEANKALIRAEMAAVLAADEADTELGHQRRVLLGMAMDADMVLDLHCDLEALYHIYTTNRGRDWGTVVAKYTGAAVSLISDESGGNAFDESCSTPWDRLAKRYGDKFPIPPGCYAATVELRGIADVYDTVAGPDAANLADWLVAVGAVSGTAPEPKHGEGEIVPLDGVDDITAPHGGILSFRLAPGAWVKPGDVVADLIDPLTNERTELKTRNDGLLYARETRRFVRRGSSIAQVTGKVQIRSGYLLSAR